MSIMKQLTVLFSLSVADAYRGNMEFACVLGGFCHSGTSSPSASAGFWTINTKPDGTLSRTCTFVANTNGGPTPLPTFLQPMYGDGAQDEPSGGAVDCADTSGKKQPELTVSTCNTLGQQALTAALVGDFPGVHMSGSFGPSFTQTPTGYQYLDVANPACPRLGGPNGWTTSMFYATPYFSAPSAGATKDPHFHFAHGDRADIRGEDGAIYNFLSAKNVSMNVRMAKADFRWSQRLVHGTKMQAASWTLRAHSGALIQLAYEASKSAVANHVLVHVNRAGRAAEKIKVTADEPKVIEGVSIRLADKTLTVDTGKWRMTAAVHSFPFGQLNEHQVLLDVSAEPKYAVEDDIVAPHGLLGQSFDGDDIAVDGAKDKLVEGHNESTTSAQGEGAIEGTIHDYRVADEFSIDFKFSRFDATTAKPRDVTKLTGVKRARSTGTRVHASDAP